MFAAIALIPVPRNTLRSTVRVHTAGLSGLKLGPQCETRPACGAPYGGSRSGYVRGSRHPAKPGRPSRQNRRWRCALQKAVGLPSFVTPPPARPLEMAGAGVQSKGVTGDSWAEAVPVGNTSADAASAVARATRSCDNCRCHSFEWLWPLHLLHRRSYSSPRALPPPMSPLSHPWTALLHQPLPSAELVEV